MKNAPRQHMRTYSAHLTPRSDSSLSLSQTKKRQTKKKKLQKMKTKKVYVQPLVTVLRLLRGTSRCCGLVLVPLGQRSKFELQKKRQNKEKLKKKKKARLLAVE